MLGSCHEQKATSKENLSYGEKSTMRRTRQKDVRLADCASVSNRLLGSEAVKNAKENAPGLF